MKNKFLVGFSGNPETTCFTSSDSSHEKRKLDRVEEGIGGTSINFALQAAELGAEVNLALTVGKDSRATLLELQLEKRFNGKLSLLPCRVGTSFAHVVIETNGTSKRTLDSFKGGYDEFPHEEIQSLVQDEAWNAVVMTGIMPDETLLVRTAFVHAVTNILTDCVRVLNPREELTANSVLFESLLPYVDVVCMNRNEFSAYTGREHINQKVLCKLHSLGPKVIMVTDGAKGVIVSDLRNRFFVPACIVEREVDATGAGDAFLAGFLTRYCAGESALNAAKFGSLVAGIAVTKVGGSNTVTTAELAKHSV